MTNTNTAKATDQKVANAVTNIPGYDPATGEIEIDLQAGGCFCGCALPVDSKSRFRQGHDMKLVSILNKAARYEIEVALHTGGTIIHLGAIEAAKWFGGSFPAKVAKHLQTPHQRKVNAEMAADRIVGGKKKGHLSVVESAPADQPRMVKGKVGRWTYDGTVEGDQFYYTNKADKVIYVPLSKVTLIED